MSMIKTDNLIFEYEKRDEEGNVIGTHRAIDEVNLDIEPGQFIAILGHNGSGKSTLAKHMNAILVPSGGTMWVDGKDTKEEENLWDVRQTAGMVFQNPDNQIIGTVVEEDVGFGPENLGVPTEEIWQRVEKSLSAVGMIEYRHHSPNKLSGGQKQRVAIAGVVAMCPKCIVLDEPTAMLDPNGRKEVLRTVEELRKREHVTVILITHYMEEVIGADRVIVMDQGHVVMDGTTREIFSQVELLKKYRLDVPQVTMLAHGLKQRGLDIKEGILTTNELIEALEKAGDWRQNQKKTYVGHAETVVKKEKKENPILKLEHIEYVYSSGTAYEKRALKDINLDIYEGEFVGVIGHTGSGKSTMIQHLNGLMKATSGALYYNGENIYDEKYNLRQLRNNVGLVFQYPEHQLFAETIYEDIAFGPRNQKKSEDEVEASVRRAMAFVDLDFGTFSQRSPFQLSGGQMRRVAIAGVVAMEPDYLIMDEPSAGLDPVSRDNIFSQLMKIFEKRQMGVILITHSMEEAAQYASRVLVMSGGKLHLDGPSRDIFTTEGKTLQRLSMDVPESVKLAQELRENGLPLEGTPLTKKELIRAIQKAKGWKVC